jgi:ABC-type Fe3+/spermidine/putrescine transport system ATPase subunit
MSVAREVESVISVTSLEKSFANEQVLRGIDFTVDDGEFCVVVGPSGSGKSTLLKCIAGLVEFDRGSISLDGRDVGALSVPERNIGFVFQDFEERLFPHMTVAENVAFGLRQAGASETEIETKTDEMLALLSIGETRDSFPSELSGGQQQRVELARQLVRECDVMLLDDPLADLDYKLQKRMELEMRQIHEELGSSTSPTTRTRRSNSPTNSSSSTRASSSRSAPPTRCTPNRRRRSSAGSSATRTPCWGASPPSTARR